MTFSVTNLSERIGAAIATDVETLVSGAHAGEIGKVLSERGVIVFRGLHLTDEQQVAFARTLGEIEQEIYKVSFDPAHNSFAAVTRGTFSWHMDRIDMDVPPLGSILSPRVLSPTGGETEFANTYAAYDALPEDRKQQIEGLRAVHALVNSQLSHTPEPSYEQFMAWRAVGRVELPLVWTHGSGRKSLVLGNSAVNILGMDPLDGLELLAYLRDWATQERFCYSHTWSVGDTVMWDNTGTLHRATPYPLDSGRMLHRTKLQGEEPLF